MISSRRMPQTNIRMPGWLREDLKRLAELNGRSLNSEIVQVLKTYANVEAPTAGTVRASVSNQPA